MFKKTIILIPAGISLNHACMNPDNTFIVEFYLDTMVSVDLSVFERIGQISANYYNQTADYTPDYYVYTSYYNKKVLISIGPFHIQFTVDTSKVSLDSLKVDTCVYKELQWLQESRIISLGKTKRELIARAFSDYEPFSLTV